MMMSRKQKLKLKRKIKSLLNDCIVIYISIATFLFSMYWFGLFVEAGSNLLTKFFNLL